MGFDCPTNGISPSGIQVNTITENWLEQNSYQRYQDTPFSHILRSDDLNWISSDAEWIFFGCSKTSSSTFLTGAFLSANTFRETTERNKPAYDNGVYYYRT